VTRKPTLEKVKPMAEAAHAGRLKISIANTLGGLKEGLSALGKWLSEQGIGTEASDSAHLVFEEIVNNISRYGFDDRREHAIVVEGEVSGGELKLTFDDTGRPFDPRTLPQPNLAVSLEDASIGGRGIMLVRAAASRLDYERTATGHNRLTVTLPKKR
jgi:sigma-B regulation protein RsbU (phosphoserine phosphatase)